MRLRTFEEPDEDDGREDEEDAEVLEEVDDSAELEEDADASEVEDEDGEDDAEGAATGVSRARGCLDNDDFTCLAVSRCMLGR